MMATVHELLDVASPLEGADSRLWRDHARRKHCGGTEQSGNWEISRESGRSRTATTMDCVDPIDSSANGALQNKQRRFA
jgi:hypothetical protein